MSQRTIIEQQSLNTIHALIMDTVRNADSGHTGGPLSSLDFTYILFKEFLSFDPDDPNWKNRDRFVLSAGHESALLYSMLTLIGWITVDDLKKFRQLNSITPGHPEFGLTPGVESTTGPLGQGVGNAVGMAVAESILRSRLGSDVIDHYTYVLHGDGDIQEPVSQGAIALAGHWGLHKLIAYYDSNEIQISGKVSRSDSTNYRELYLSHGWQVIDIDGHNLDDIRVAIRQAQMEIEKPTVIIGKTIMAKNTFSMEGSASTHGSPLPAEEIQSTKEKLGLDPQQKFGLPEAILDDFRQSFKYYRQDVSAWKAAVERKNQNVEFKKSWQLAFDSNVSPDIEPYQVGDKVATRKAWGRFLESYQMQQPFIVGGSADLEPSNATAGFAKAVGDYSKENTLGRNFAYGVREFPMGTINNGIALHGGMKVFGATFFVFSDYERPALRVRALMEIPVVSIYTHDSIFVGEDGPTHQPVEHLMACRTIPNLIVARPCDANETIAVCKIAFSQSESPYAIILSRQSLEVQNKSPEYYDDHVSLGAYIHDDCDGESQVIIFASGSEMELAYSVKKLIKNTNIRIVNFVSWELFDKQESSYQSTVLGNNNNIKVSIEAGITDGWQKYTGLNGLNFGINSFGTSAPGPDAAEYFKLSAEYIADSIVNKIKILL